MSYQEILRQAVRQYESSPHHNKDMERRENALKARNEFLDPDHYPFRSHPEKIDELTRDRVDDFFGWIEFKLMWLGKIYPRGRRARHEAANLIEVFKDCLRQAIPDRSKTPAQRVDLPPWNEIPGFGKGRKADRQIAKKIISLYYLNEILPIFNTTHLVHYCKKLRVDVETEARRTFGLSYADVTLTVGQKWQLLTESLLHCKDDVESLRDKDNIHFMYVLSRTFLPDLHAGRNP